jgi:tyrosyl-tRNA synthetase
MEPQVIMTLPILEGLDGVQKMSKSLGNYIGIDEPPDVMYGKAMSIPDSLIVRYMELATSMSPEEIGRFRQALTGQTMNPRDAKVRLAKALVTQYHTESEAESAAKRFARTFGAGVFPEDAPTVMLPPDAIEPGPAVWIVRLLTAAGAAPSNSEARRLIQQGGVEVDGTAVRDVNQRVSVNQERRIQVGKRRFFKVLPLRGFRPGGG